MIRIKAVVQRVWHFLDGVRRGLHLLMLLAIAAVVVGASHHSLPIVPFKTALVVHFDGRIVEQESEDSLGRSIRAVSGSDGCLLYTSPSPRDRQKSRMPSSA